MGYTTRLKEHQLKLLEPIIEKLDKLSPGGSFALRDTEVNINQLRYLIYSHLYGAGIKPYFVIRRESPTTLRVVRRSEPAPQIIEGSANDKARNFVIERMLEIEDEAEALAFARAETNDILFMSQVLEEWRRVRGA